MPSPKPIIHIIDCGAGNLHSVRKAFAAVLPEGASLAIITDAAELKNATHIVLPGVGAFADCMAGLTALPGMRTALEEAVLTRKTPFLGICVGMQMLFERGHEFGTHAGLGWLKGEVAPITPTDPALRIPHMGWNQLHLHSPLEGESKSASAAPRDSVGGLTHPLFTNIEDNSFVYFVHSYAATGTDPKNILATAEYGGDITAMVARDNITGMQFHPEKSQKTGLHLIRNFINL